MSMWKVSNVFGLRTSRNPQNHKSCQYRQTWGQPRSVTLDDLWMVMMQCEMSDVVMCWPKSCKLSPFQSMAAFTWLKTRFPRKIGRRLFLLRRNSSVTWPDTINFLCEKLRKECHISYRLVYDSTLLSRLTWIGSFFRKIDWVDSVFSQVSWLVTESNRFHRVGHWVDNVLGTGLIESIELIQSIQKRSKKLNFFSEEGQQNRWFSQKVNKTWYWIELIEVIELIY